MTESRFLDRRRSQPRQRQLCLERLEARQLLAANLVISELLAVNDNGLVDENGDRSDWIEVLNADTASVDLEDWSLTDEAGELDKWTFPSRSLEPGDSIVVFASGKDRDGDGPLHTSFKLSGSGEYLALVDPEGQVAFDYSPAFPPQVADVSYGIGNELAATSLLASGAAGKLLIPGDSSLDGDENDTAPPWTEPGFDDSSWSSVSAGIGFESEPAPPPVGTLIADSVSEFSVEQGRGGWSYGYWDKSTDNNQIYEANEFTPFLFIGSNRVSRTNHWNGQHWDFTSSASLTTELTPTGGKPGASTVSDPVIEHWAIRRYTSEVAGTIHLSGQIANADPSGDGVTVRIFAGGSEIFSRDLNDITTSYAVSTAVEIGTPIDFVIDSGGQLNSDGDETVFTAAVQSVSSEPAADLTGTFLTDIQDQMLSLASSAYLRLPFEVADPSSFDALILGMQFDAGFVAYLNGTEIARSGAPSELHWDSTATSERDDNEVLGLTEVNLTKSLDLLQIGTNVLAIHGLNVAVSDPDFLINAELEGRAFAIDADTTQYFVSPTPGGPNGFGTEAVGPIIAGVQHTPAVPVDSDEVYVTAVVTPSFGAIAQVTLHHRHMFGATAAVTMFDDGQHADGEAGDGVYGAMIPQGRASQAGEMIRYYVTATDDSGTDSRVPTFYDPVASSEYLGYVVSDPDVVTELQRFEWFVETPSAAETGSGTRASVYYNSEFYDNVFVRIRGDTARNWPKKSYKFDFNNDHDFRFDADLPRVDEINVNTTFTDKSYLRTFLAYESFRDAGVAGSIAFPMRVEQNGAFYSVAQFVEQVDRDMLRRNGLSDEGALYKAKANGMGGVNGRIATSGMPKKNRRDEDASDMQALIDAMLLPEAQRELYLFDNIDLPAVVNNMATNIVIQNIDRTVKNFYMYRDTTGNGEWRIIPWDVDLSFGPDALNTDTVASTNDGGNHASHPLMGGSTATYSGLWNGLLDAIYDSPRTREMFLRRLRTLADRFLGEAGRYYEDRIDELVELMAPDVALDRAKWGSNANFGSNATMQVTAQRIKEEYLVPRREHLFVNHNINNPNFPGNVGIPDAQESGVTLEFGAIGLTAPGTDRDEEFLEITNPNSTAIDLSGWTVEGDIEYAFSPGTIIPAGETLFLSPDVNKFRARAGGPAAGQGLFVQGNYDGHLDRRGGTLRIVSEAGETVAETTFAGDPLPAQRDLRITELMYAPGQISDDDLLDASGFEFVELQNIGSETLDLTNVFFSDGIQFSFAGSAVTTLEPNEFVLVVKNRQVFESRYDTTDMPIAGEFQGQLDNGGERIRLRYATGDTIQSFRYSDAWYSAADGAGFSLHVVDAGADEQSWGEPSQWLPSREFGGSPGTNDTFGMPAAGSIVVSEALTNGTDGQLDWIELLNTTNEPIDINGWFLSDNRLRPDKSVISGRVSIPGGGRIVFHQGTDFDFGLSSFGSEQVTITGGDGNGNLLGYQWAQPFGAAMPGVAFGLHENSSGKVQFVAMEQQTPGQPNSLPATGPVVINEVMYHPLDDGSEFIEVRNVSDAAVTLDSWNISGAVEFTFPAGAQLEPGSRAFVVPIDPDQYRAEHGMPGDEIAIWGPFDGSLNNGGERLELNRPSVADSGDAVWPILVDHVRYDDMNPWPIVADGQGPSLERLHPIAFGDDSQAWQQSAADGSPGLENIGPDATPPSVPGNVQLELLPGGVAHVSWNAAIDAESGIAYYIVTRDGEEIATTTETFYDEKLVFGAADYRYTIVAVNGDQFQSPTSRAVVAPQVDTIRFQYGAAPDADYTSMEDTNLVESSPTSTLGRGPSLYAVADATGEESRILLQWDITAVPVDATVVAASMTFNVTDGSGGPIRLFQVTKDWNERQASWNNSLTGTPWQLPGANGAEDINQQPLATALRVNKGLTTIDLDPTGVTLVQAWIDGSISNQGLLLANMSGDRFDISSSELSRLVDLRPMLTLHTLAPQDIVGAVSGVSVGGTSWSESFQDHVAATGENQVSLDDPTWTMPWSSVDQITAQLAANVPLDQQSLSLTDSLGSSATIVDFAYDADSRQATWTLAEPLTASIWSATIVDSGGAQFDFTINLLPGDGTGNGTVDVRDIQALRDRILTDLGDDEYSARYDFDTSGHIDVRDLQILRDHLLIQQNAIEAADWLFEQDDLLGEL